MKIRIEWHRFKIYQSLIAVGNLFMMKTICCYYLGGYSQVTSVNRTVGQFFSLPENVKAKYQLAPPNLNGWLGCAAER